MSRSSAAPWNPLTSAGAELRGLVEHDAGGLVAVGAAVFGERVAEQLARVGLGEVGPAVGLGDLRCAAADDDAVAALVEDLGDGGVQFLAVGGAVEADADVAGGQVGVAAGHPPGRAAGLVVQRDVQVPRPGGLVLERAAEASLPLTVPSQVSRRMTCNGHARPRAWALSRSWKSRPISVSACSSSASASSPVVGRARSSCSRISSGRAHRMTRQRPVSASDRAASAYRSAPSAMAAFTSALASLRSCRSGISRTRASSKTSSAPKFVSVLKPGKGWCRFSWPGLASFASIGDRHRSSQPRRPVDGARRADEADRDGVGCGRGVRVGRAVHGDAVARVDVPVPGPEFQLRLAAGRGPS